MKVMNRAVSAGLAFALAFGTCLPVAVASPQTELAAASQQLEQLGGELSSIQEDLAAQTADLEATSYQIGEKQEQIEQTNAELEEAKQVLGGRMRSSYKTGPSSLVDVLLGSASLDDVVSRIYYMDKVATSDAESIAAVRMLEERLTTEKADLEQTEQNQQAAVAELQGQVDTYTEKVAEAQRYYNSLDAEVQRLLAEQQAAEENARIQAAVAAAEQDEQDQSSDTPQEESNQTEESGDQDDSSGSQQTPTTTTPSTTTDDSNDGGAAPSNNNTNTTTNPSSTPSTSSPSKNVPSGGGLSSAYAAIGCPYVWGATGPSSFDCSGLICYCYGYARGRTTYSMIASLKADGSWKTSMSQLSVGDLVFTSEGHVGIYVGGGQMIHAPSPGRTVEQASVYAFIGGGTY